MPRRDLYGILGVPTRAAPGEIKRAYRRIAFEFHPDVGNRPDPERFREAHEAYEILNDPNQRRSYDIKLGKSAAVADGRAAAIESVGNDY